MKKKIFIVVLSLIMIFSSVITADAASVKVGKVTLNSAEFFDGTVTLSWNKVSGASGYKIYMSDVYEGGYKRIATVSGNYRSEHKFTAPKTDDSYYYIKMRAYKVVDGKIYYGKYSDVKSFYTRNIYPTFVSGTMVAENSPYSMGFFIENMKYSYDISIASDSIFLYDLKNDSIKSKVNVSFVFDGKDGSKISATGNYIKIEPGESIGIGTEQTGSKILLNKDDYGLFYKIKYNYGNFYVLTDKSGSKIMPANWQNVKFNLL